MKIVSREPTGSVLVAMQPSCVYAFGTYSDMFNAAPSQADNEALVERVREAIERAAQYVDYSDNWREVENWPAIARAAIRAIEETP